MDIELDDIETGDEIMVHLRAGLDERYFGSGWRIGTVVARGRDLLAAEPMIALDDGGPPIYAAHVDFAELLRRHDEPERESDPVVYDGGR